MPPLPEELSIVLPRDHGLLISALLMFCTGWPVWTRCFGSVLSSVECLALRVACGCLEHHPLVLIVANASRLRSQLRSTVTVWVTHILQRWVKPTTAHCKLFWKAGWYNITKTRAPQCQDTTAMCHPFQDSRASHGDRVAKLSRLPPCWHRKGETLPQLWLLPFHFSSSLPQPPSFLPLYLVTAQYWKIC